MKNEELQQFLAQRTEIILAGEDNHRQAMREIEAAAYSGGLVTDATHLEYETLEEFSLYLWVHNPLALEWLNIRRGEGRLLDPRTRTDMFELIDLLGS